MNLDSIPLFSMLKSRLGYEGLREKLIGQNVANADTPGYAPKDLKTFTVPSADSGGGKLTMAQPISTGSANFITTSGTDPKSQWKTITTSDSETTMDGNKVALEDQMSHMAESRMEFEAALGFYQKSMTMIQLAERTPGKGT